MTAQVLKLRQRFDNTTLDQLTESLNKRKANAFDIEAKLKEVRILDNGCLKFGKGEVYSLDQWSFNQWCQRLKVPVDFLRRCPKDVGNSSQKSIFDYWKEQRADKRLLFRVKTHEEKDMETGAVGRVRAVLSDRYSVFDNHDILPRMIPYVKKYNLQPQISKVTERAMHLRLLFPEEVIIGKTLDGKDDKHNFAFHLLNSEIGAYSAVQGDMSIFRQVCSNGLIVVHDREHLLKMSHGRSLGREEFKNALSAAFETFIGKREEMELIVESAQTDKLASKEHALTEVRSILSASHASDETITRAEKMFTNEPQVTRFGVIQAVTAAARTLPVDRRVALETAAGEYLLRVAA